MPFSEEMRKCPHCGEHEAWNMMVHVDGEFYCQDCYIKKFGNPKEEKKPEYWIFTFGCGDLRHAGKCVMIKGSYAEARTKMVERYGTHWAFQYSREEWEEMKNNPHRTYRMEELMEVIE